MANESLTSDNLINHAAARIQTFGGVKAGFDANIATWRKLYAKQDKNAVAFQTCAVCENDFAADDVPYFGIFLISGKRTSRVICKECAYRLSRHVIEADGTMHNGKYVYPKRR